MSDLAAQVLDARAPTTIQRFRRHEQMAKAWLAEKGLRRFKGAEDVSEFVKSINRNTFNTKKKMSNLRVDLSRFIRLASPDEAFPFLDSELYKMLFDGVWYKRKGTIKVPGRIEARVPPKLPKRGVLDKSKLLEMLSLFEAHPELLRAKGTKNTFRDFETVSEAFLIIHGCCLRIDEFCSIKVGDYDPIQKTLFLRKNKTADAKRGSERTMCARTIPVLFPSVQEILEKRQDSLALKNRQDLLFRFGEVSEEDIREFVLIAAEKLGWTDLLIWQPHCMRHGAAQDMRLLAKEANAAAGKIVISDEMVRAASHMEDVTYEGCYGIKESHRKKYFRSLKARRK